jgi:iron complex outermembrane recepter protein
MSNNFKFARLLVTSVSFAALGAVGAAWAQDEAVEDEIVVTATGRSAALQDVPLSVTAVSGEALRQSGAQDLRDVAQVAPSLQMTTGQSNATGTVARVRGIGTGSDNPGFESAVGIFVDGVYRARAGAALSDLPDLERVEVLRGPQGTLFGRNTSAGAISVVTAGPHSEPGMYGEALFGVDDLGETGARAGVNMPASDVLAFRLDGSIRARDGYVTDLISGDDIQNTSRWSARGQALWDISPDASLRIIVDGAGSDEACCGVTPLVYGTTQGVISALTAGAGTPAINPEGRAMTVTPGRNYSETTDEFGVSGELDWNLGFANLTSITAWRDWESTRDQDIDFNLLDIAYRDDAVVGFQNFTQEFRLQGEAGRLNWLVGVFYGDETLDFLSTIRVGAQKSLYSNTAIRAATGCELYDTSAASSSFQCVASTAFAAFPAVLAAVNATNGGYLLADPSGAGQVADDWSVSTESLAFFTHNEINFTDQLVLTLGLRANHESKDLNANLLSASPSCASLQAMEAATSAATPTPGGIVAAIQASGLGSTAMNQACNPAINPVANGLWTGNREEEELSGTASLAYHVSDDVMLFGGYSRGYKAGGFNIDRSGFAITPALTNPALLSVSQLSFEPEFTDAYELGVKSTIFGGGTTLNLTAFYQQIHDFQLNAFNGFNFITRNIPEVISQGAELEVSTRPTDGLTLTGGLVYNEAFYDSTVVFNTLDPVPNTIVAGTPLAHAPEWTATGAIAYEVPIGGDLRALFYVDGRWNSEYRTQTLNRHPGGATDNDAYAIFNARIGIGPQDEHWSVEIWGQNLGNQYYTVIGFSPVFQNSFAAFPNEPQTYGVTVRARY